MIRKSCPIRSGSHRTECGRTEPDEHHERPMQRGPPRFVVLGLGVVLGVVISRKLTPTPEGQ